MSNVRAKVMIPLGLVMLGCGWFVNPPEVGAGLVMIGLVVAGAETIGWAKRRSASKA